VQGTPMYRVVKKQKFLKHSLKSWSKQGRSFPGDKGAPSQT